MKTTFLFIGNQHASHTTTFLYFTTTVLIVCRISKEKDFEVKFMGMRRRELIKGLNEDSEDSQLNTTME